MVRSQDAGAICGHQLSLWTKVEWRRHFHSAGEMTQSAKCLPRKHEVLNLAKRVLKMLRILGACNSELRSGDRQVLGTHWPARPASQQVLGSVRDPV